MGLNIEVTLNVITCHCGACYAVPHWVSAVYYVCPFCSQRKIEALRIEIDNLHKEILRQAHIVNGLRGALKRR